MLAAEKSHGRTDRFVDVASLVLISVAAVLTALCGYQSGRWGGEQARLYSVANADRLHSAEDADRASILEAIDVAVFVHYVQAVDSGNARFAAFLYRRFRPEFVPALHAWLDTKPFKNTSAPPTPFSMPQYTLRAHGEAERYTKSAQDQFDAALEATTHADEFLLLTVLFAAVSFLAGISTKMAFPRHAIVVALASIATLYGVIRLVQLPFMVG